MTMLKPETLYWTSFKDEFLVFDPETKEKKWKPETPERVVQSYNSWLKAMGFEYYSFFRRKEYVKWKAFNRTKRCFPLGYDRLSKGFQISLVDHSNEALRALESQVDAALVWRK